MSILSLRLVLGLTGAVVMLFGANVGFGGIQTLGLQGNGAFFEVTDGSLFAIRDNHIRFAGGLLFGTGLLLAGSAMRLDLAQCAVPGVAVVFVIGGVARLSSGDMQLLTSADIAPSLLFEVIGFPVLAAWTLWATRPAARA